MYIATETFVDPTDGVLVEKGRTYVSPNADVFRLYPSRFKKAPRRPDQAPGRLGGDEFPRPPSSRRRDVRSPGMATTTRAMEVALMPKLKRKPGNAFRDVPVVTCVKTFLAEEVTLIAGEKRRGEDPVVDAHWGAFSAGDLLPAEVAKIVTDELPLDPPVQQRDERIRIGQGTTPPPHRQVVATADTFIPLPFAPGVRGLEAEARPRHTARGSARAGSTTSAPRSCGSTRSCSSSRGGTSRSPTSSG